MAEDPWRKIGPGRACAAKPPPSPAVNIARRPAVLPTPRGRGTASGAAAGELRQMALHLETAALLERRAQRAGDPREVAVLRRRAEHRRREAARIRERLATEGIAMSRAARRQL